MAEVSDKRKDFAAKLKGGMEAAPASDGLKAMWRRWTGDDSSASDVKPAVSPSPSASKKPE